MYSFRKGNKITSKQMANSSEIDQATLVRRAKNLDGLSLMMRDIRYTNARMQEACR